VEIGGRHKLITLCLSSSAKITLKRIYKSCVSGVISGRLRKASSVRFETLLNSLGMGIALELIGA
jgi:hypothetical protein